MMPDPVRIEMNETPESDLQHESPPRRRWGVVLVWVVVLGLLAILGVGLIRTQEGHIQVGDEVPADLVFHGFEGEQIPFAEFRGQVVLVNFWASWCKPCEQEAAELEQAYQIYHDRGVVFLGVNYVDTEREAKAYLKKFGITYPNGPDLGTSISQVFRVRGVPETYILGPDGRLKSFKIGPYTSLSEITEQLEGVLAAEAAGS